jgi:ribosomal protein S18 acetylase RimI-like enzyme
MDTHAFRRAEDFFEKVELTITAEQFAQLPRHPAYAYAYSNGRATLTPRPHYVPVGLDLAEAPARDRAMTDVRIRRLEADDWEALAPTFSSAFQDAAPFALMDPVTRVRAARLCLTRTETGADGRVVDNACLVIFDPRTDDTLLGAVIVTRVPYTYGSVRTALKTDRTVPHLTWIFVHDQLRRKGIGRALLDAACTELRALGDTRLASTFMVGNTSAMLWHWRMGFRL